MEWPFKFLLKLTLLAVGILAVFSFVRQLFSPIEKPVAVAGPGGSRLPGPLPKGGMAVPAVGETTPAPLLPPAHQGHPGEQGGSITPQLPPPLADPGKPITEATHDQILYRFLDAQAQGNRLTIRLQVLNKGLDRMMEIGSLPWSKTLFYNERNEVYLPEEVRIANGRANGGKTRAMVVAGVPAEILLMYSELPMAAGILSFRQIALMQLDVALFSTEQAYRNAFAEPIAVSRPTFRLLAITDGSVAAAPRVAK
jgi:hypothetical protein